MIIYRNQKNYIYISYLDFEKFSIVLLVDDDEINEADRKLDDNFIKPNFSKRSLKKIKISREFIYRKNQNNFINQN